MEDENLVTDEPYEDEDAQEARNLSFALESHLRDFLANNGNLSIIEGGLNLDKTEFSIDNGRGRIDILAVDKNDKYVVIELKLSQGRNKTLGQLIYYMGWVDKEIGKDKKPCRGIIIAKEIRVLRGFMWSRARKCIILRTLNFLTGLSSSGYGTMRE